MQRLWLYGLCLIFSGLLLNEDECAVNHQEKIPLKRHPMECIGEIHPESRGIMDDKDLEKKCPQTSLLDCQG